MSRAATPAITSTIAYNSCRNRHCPKCQGAAARAWLAERQADLLPVPYYHVVFTLPAPIAAIAFQNKAVVYDLLFRTAADTLLTIAADPKHLGARIGLTAVLHTWGSALTHHPHVHIVVPGGGLCPGRVALDRLPAGLLPARAGALPPVPPAVPRPARRRPPAPARLAFLGDLAPLADPTAFAAHAGAAAPRRVGRLRQAALRRTRGGARLPVPLHPSGRDREQPAPRPRRARRDVPLEGLPRPGRRDGRRVDQDHDARGRTSSSAASCSTSCPTASTASATTACSPAARGPPTSPGSGTCSPQSPRIEADPQPAHDEPPAPACPCCGGRLVIVERFRSGMHPRAHPTAVIRIDTS